MEILKIINFDCKNERFAEVFGDCIETEDIQAITKEASKIFKASNIRAVNSADTPDQAFEYIDCLVMDKLGKLSPRAKFGDKYELIRRFFMFVNDAYTWGDLEDLRRWEEDFQRQTADRFKGEALRSQIFFKYCRELGRLAPECVQTVSDEITSADLVGFYLGLF